MYLCMYVYILYIRQFVLVGRPMKSEKDQNPSFLKGGHVIVDLVTMVVLNFKHSCFSCVDGLTPWEDFFFGLTNRDHKNP